MRFMLATMNVIGSFAKFGKADFGTAARRGGGGEARETLGTMKGVGGALNIFVEVLLRLTKVDFVLVR
jgi:hypothetical protein